MHEKKLKQDVKTLHKLILRMEQQSLLCQNPKWPQKWAKVTVTGVWSFKYLTVTVSDKYILEGSFKYLTEIVSDKASMVMFLLKEKMCQSSP